jgi:hypothetical protein
MFLLAVLCLGAIFTVVRAQAPTQDPRLISCPAGNYCGGAGNGPQACPQGTYNNYTGMTVCIACPPGFACPYRGLSTPVPCPPGFSCDGFGTMAANILCTPGYYCKLGVQCNNPFNTNFTILPQPCPAGTYCLAGVMDNITNDDVPGHPHTCNQGYYCPPASGTYVGCLCRACSFRNLV